MTQSILGQYLVCELIERPKAAETGRGPVIDALEGRVRRRHVPKPVSGSPLGKLLMPGQTLPFSEVGAEGSVGTRGGGRTRHAQRREANAATRHQGTSPNLPRLPLSTSRADLG
jgi:hypothetical protein